MKMLVNNKVSYLLILCCLSMLHGCGFHLRGIDQEMKMTAQLNQIYVSGDDEIADLIRRQLQVLNINQARQKNNAAVLLTILSSGINERLISFSSASQSREYELKMTALFNVKKDGEYLTLDDQRVSQSRNYLDNTIDRLGKEAEKQTILKEMKATIANQIINRTVYILKAP